MKKVLICAMMSVFMLSGCSMFSANEGIIKVNDKVIKRGEFDKAFDKEINNSFLKSFGGTENFVKSDDNFMYVLFKEKVSKELIVKTLLDQEIEKRGIKISDEDIKNEMKSIVDKVGSKDELNNLLKKRGVSNSEFTESLKHQIKVKKLIDSIEIVKISDAEAQKFYNENLKKFKRNEQVRASHILVAADSLQLIKEFKDKNKNLTPEELNKKVDSVLAEKKAKAEELLKKVQADPDSFAKIAQAESDDKASGERGGELGYFEKEGQMVPEFANAAFSMKPNTINDKLVKTQFGYHIIKVTDRVEAGTMPFVKVKDEIKFYLETEEQIKILKNLTDSLLKDAKIEYLDKEFDTEKFFNKKLSDTDKNEETKK